MCIYHTLNITELSNGRRKLTATLDKCNLHKWNTLYAYENFTSCAIFFFSVGSFEQFRKKPLLQKLKGKMKIIKKSCFS